MSGIVTDDGVPNPRHAWIALAMSTMAFSVCFAAWLIYGVLITWLVAQQVFFFTTTQVGWLIGVPVLTGSIFRLPVGVLTDRYGGRVVMTGLMLLSAIPLFAVSWVDSYAGFLIAGLCFGLVGASFSTGVAYISTWFPKERIGTALGIFGAGNAGAAVTSICGPILLDWLSDDGANPEAWRWLPQIYAVILLGTAVLFFRTVKHRVESSGVGMNMAERLQPLKSVRVWRFGLYYFLVFGAFVALCQWMIPYYVNAYRMSVTSAGFLASIFSFPSGVIRALGGWISDRWGARTVMYWILGINTLACFLMVIPPMTIETPGTGVMARSGGVVKEVTSDRIVVNDSSYSLLQAPSIDRVPDDAFLVLPTVDRWQEPLVKPGDLVTRRQLLAAGVTQVYYQANVWIFTFLLFTVGIVMGIGKAAVYKHIPTYFPDRVGVTGGMVGVLGGLGGVVCPILFGYLLNITGMWSSCWLFLAILSLVCLIWMHLVIQGLISQKAPDLAQRMERGGDGWTSGPNGTSSSWFRMESAGS